LAPFTELFRIPGSQENCHLDLWTAQNNCQSSSSQPRNQKGCPDISGRHCNKGHSNGSQSRSISLRLSPKVPTHGTLPMQSGPKVVPLVPPPMQSGPKVLPPDTPLCKVTQQVIPLGTPPSKVTQKCSKSDQGNIPGSLLGHFSDTFRTLFGDFLDTLGRLLENLSSKRLLDDFWETFGRLLGDFWKTLEKLAGVFY